MYQKIRNYSRVLQQTRERARTLGLELVTLTPTFDIDDVDDLARLREQLVHATPATCARTRELLIAT